MPGDYSRDTFIATKHYRSVRMQQGRVQVDADWNEQADIHAHRDERSTEDAVGRCGAPLHDAGFAVTVTAGGANLMIGKGRYYIDGILCENEQDVLSSAAPTVGALPAQPDLPGVGAPGTTPPDNGPETYLAYLDVWLREITALEDSSIREIALGGPDTGARLKTVWQVRVKKVTAGAMCSQFDQTWTPDSPATPGAMSARAQPGETSIDLCAVPASGGFRRLENQLYRVEIHDGNTGSGPFTFKWSRDNGMVAARLLDIAGDDLTVSDIGKDAVLSFAPGQWVELSDEGRVLRGEPGILVEIGAVEGSVLRVSDWHGRARTMADFGDGPTVRRWDSAGAISVTPSTPAEAMIDLEDGVQIGFQAGRYQPYDYWTIPARSLNGTVEWPVDDTVTPPQPRFEPRQGIEHHYCPLALLTFDGTAWTHSSDCRKLFPPLTELGALEYVGGDGQEAMPDLTQATRVRLAQPLQVGVANRPGARVRYRVTLGNGQLIDATNAASTGTSIDVLTGQDGIASCLWDLDQSTQSQQAEARLLDDADQLLPLPVRFNANLSVAGQVAYLPPTGCAALQGDETVQSALDQLTQSRILFYVGGDGQETVPNAAQPATRIALARPLQVGVTSACGLVVGAMVRFQIPTGGGAGRLTSPTSSGASVDVPTGADGVATCPWEMDATTPSQQVEARLLDGAGNPTGLPVRFNATLSVAAEVAYDAAACQPLQGANTVQDAITRLCQMGLATPGIHIKSAVFGDQTATILKNDASFPVTLVETGIKVDCDAPIAAAALGGKAPIGFLTLELPFPFNQADIQLWSSVGTGAPVIGFQPLIVEGMVAPSDPDGTMIVWTPTGGGIEALRRLFPALAVADKTANRAAATRVLAQFTLKGNFIWSAKDAGLFLDGEAFGVPEPTKTGLSFGGDGRRGGDFEMWFWVTPRSAPPKLTDKVAEKVADKPVDKVMEKPTDKIADKPTEVKAPEGPPVGPRGRRPAARRPSKKRGEGEGRSFIPPEERPEPGPEPPQKPEEEKPRARRRRPPP